MALGLPLRRFPLSLCARALEMALAMAAQHEREIFVSVCAGIGVGGHG